MLKLGRHWSLILGTVFVICLIPQAQSLVNLRTGNYNVSATDVSYPGGYDFELTRVYNSKSPFNGLFSWGWGNELELYLSLEADGSVVVHEYGGGMEIPFYPEGWSQKDLDAAIEELVGLAKKEGKLNSSAALQDYKTKLQTKSFFRAEEYARFTKLKKIKPKVYQVGTKYRSERAPFQLIKSTATGYERVSDTGTVEKFNKLGQLFSIQLPNKHFISLTYKNGKLEKLVDSLNRKLFFTFNKKGHIERIEGEGKNVATYKYNANAELIQAKGFDGVTYQYEYSKDGYYNLQKISYDKPKPGKIEIQYHATQGEFFHHVKSVKDADSSLTTYDYSKPRGADSLKIAVAVKLPDSTNTFKSSYDYTLKTKPTGEEWIPKLVEDRQGVVTTKIYEEKSGYPIEIQRDTRSAKFTYDSIGRIVNKVTSDSRTKPAVQKTVQVSYDKATGKISEVTEDPSDEGKKATTQYKYDTLGNLISARQDKDVVTMVYDKLNRMSTMVDGTGTRFDFTYDNASRPITVSQKAKGSLKLSYDQQGNLIPPDTSSPGLSAISADLERSNQTLRKLLEPAKIDFSGID